MSNWSCGVRDKNKSFLKKVSGPESENTSEMQISTVVPILETKLSEMLCSRTENISWHGMPWTSIYVGNNDISTDFPPDYTVLCGHISEFQVDVEPLHFANR